MPQNGSLEQAVARRCTQCFRCGCFLEKHLPRSSCSRRRSDWPRGLAARSPGAAGSGSPESWSRPVPCGSCSWEGSPDGSSARSTGRTIVGNHRRQVHAYKEIILNVQPRFLKTVADHSQWKEISSSLACNPQNLFIIWTDFLACLFLLA